MLGLQRESVAQVGIEVGGALAGNPVDEVERDVVKSGITESVDGTPDVVRAGPSLEHREEVRAEALGAERDAVHAAPPQQLGQLRGHRLRVCLDRHLVGRRQRAQQPLELCGSGERRGPAAKEDALQPRREGAPLERQLREQRVDVGGVLPGPALNGHEVAVTAARRAERQVHVEVPDRAGAGHFFPPSRLSTARNASCGTSTAPTCFIRFLPFFCCSSSFRLRVMSPP